MHDRWTQMLQLSPPDDAALADLPENGWGSLLAWIAGPGRVFLRPSSTDERQTTVTTTTADGVTTVVSRRRTAADQSIVDDSINDYLQDAGVPPGPAGATWTLRLPGGATEHELWARASTYAIDRYSSAPTPADELERLTRALDDWLT